MLQMTRLRLKLKSQSNKPIKGKRRQTELPRREVKLLQNLKSIVKKSRRTRRSKTRKNPHKAIRQTVMTKRLEVIPGHQKRLQGLAAY